MALLVPAIQNAPLLDKRDLTRFSRLGRTMDAALRFQSFRARRDGDPERAVFSSAHTTRFAGLLELLPLQGSFELSMVDKSPNRFGRNRHNGKFPVKPQSVR